MPIRNLWSLECGEVITAEALRKNVEGCEVYFPLHDVGIDLLVVNGKKHASVQVKESRYYPQQISWHVIFRKKFVRDKERVDFYVFLTYLPKIGEHGTSKFENKFIIVPTSDLESLIKEKKVDKRGRYSFCFNFEGKKVADKRDVPTDYSEYLNRWDLIKQA
jgi:hypothetical protein